MTRLRRTYLVGLGILALGAMAVRSLAETPKPTPAAPKAKDTAATARTPHVYFIEGDTLLDAQMPEDIRRRFDEAIKLHEEARLRALESIPELENLMIVPPEAPEEVILPDTVYTTEVTIGPEGIEYYDSAGDKTVIHGRPVRPDMPFVFSEEGSRLVTRKRASNITQLGVDIHIARSERVEGDVVAIGGNVLVEGEVKGDAVAVFGDVTVDGYVHGSAIAPMGKVQINPGGVVRKDINASAIEELPGSLVGGRTTYTGVRFPGGGNVLRGFTFVFMLIHIGLAVFIVFLIVLGHVFAARNIATVRARIATNGIKSFVIGLLLEFLGIPVLFILLLITVIGIPVAVLVLPLAVAVAVILGLAAFGLMLGEKLAGNTGLHLPTQLGKTIAGVGGILLLMVFGALLVLVFKTPLSVVGWTVFAIGHAIVFVAVTTGLGAVTLTRFGNRPKTAPVASGASESVISPSPPDTTGESLASPQS